MGRREQAGNRTAAQERTVSPGVLQNLLSHEFKTPVFAIQGYVDTLAGALANPEVNKKFLEKTAKNVDRLTHLLNDLDEISSLEEVSWYCTSKTL